MVIWEIKRDIFSRFWWNLLYEGSGKGKIRNSFNLTAFFELEYFNYISQLTFNVNITELSHNLNGLGCGKVLDQNEKLYHNDHIFNKKL